MLRNDFGEFLNILVPLGVHWVTQIFTFVHETCHLFLEIHLVIYGVMASTVFIAIILRIYKETYYYGI